MSKHISVDFKWRHYEGELILLCVRWYLRYRLSYRDIAEMMKEQNLPLHASTIYRWVQHYAPKIQKRSAYFLKEPSGSWHLDETYIKIKGQWVYLYRAIDSQGQTIDFYLSRTRNHRDSKRFLGKLIRLHRAQVPHTITTDANATYPIAIQQLKAENLLPKDTFHRTSKYLNNRFEQDHRRIKW